MARGVNITVALQRPDFFSGLFLLSAYDLVGTGTRCFNSSYQSE